MRLVNEFKENDFSTLPSTSRIACASYRAGIVLLSAGKAPLKSGEEERKKKKLPERENNDSE